MTDGRALVALDSAEGTLFRIGDKPKLAASNIGSGSFALSAGRLYVWDPASRSLRQIE